MTSEILINAFHMNTVGHQAPGLWTHPRDRARHYTDLAYWADLARTLERGLIDGLFLADVLGIYDVFGGSADAALRHAIQVPVNDPSLLIPAMAMVTEHLGFGVTCTLSFEPPYPFARRMSTLDHLTKGRVGWNIVTGYLDSAAKGMGERGQVGHDRRYDMAEDYMQVVYKLWEGSWEDGAALADKEARVFADPAKVHRVRHDGAFYQLDAIHLCEPSPQRTPLLYQAGASGRGRQFAGAHAECVFINGPTKESVRPYVQDLRRQAIAAGREPGDLKILTLATPIIGRTSAEAREKHEEYKRHVSHEGALALMSGWTGVDLSKYGLDDVIRYEKTDANQSALETFTKGELGRTWTVRQIAEKVAIGGRSPLLVGSASEVADQMISWIDDTGIDGFNLAYVVMPESFTDLVDLLVPELQARGRFKTAYRPGTLREKLFGAPRLPSRHPAAHHRC
ncbi:MAG: LLM class flavin-dependent oxidoreductase [Hyphomicrobiaceae bacterium]|nr:LLM class flavin-dependent oxidoreductase [Hyphomicrobiaceae bacterium]